MSSKPIYITEFDLTRLTSLVHDAYRTHHGREYLAKLQAELDRAIIVTPQTVPEDVITMNSVVRLLDVDTGEEETYSLVFPENADIGAGKISILAPIGTGMLGYQLGDTFEWVVPARTRRMNVVGIFYQPEAQGDYHL